MSAARARRRWVNAVSQARSQIELNCPIKGVSFRRAIQAELKLPPLAKVYGLGGAHLLARSGYFSSPSFSRSIIAIPIRERARSGRYKAKHGWIGPIFQEKCTRPSAEGLTSISYNFLFCACSVQNVPGGSVMSQMGFRTK